MLTDVGSLEFRILANRKHDARGDGARAGPERPDQAPVAVPLGSARRDLDRHQPEFTSDTDHRPAAERGRRTSTRVPRSTLTGKDAREPNRSCVSVKQHGQHA